MKNTRPVWRKDPFKISFLFRSVYDIFPFPVNLRQLDLVQDSNCKRCDKRGLIGHILSRCKEAPTRVATRQSFS